MRCRPMSTATGPRGDRRRGGAARTEHPRERQVAVSSGCASSRASKGLAAPPTAHGRRERARRESEKPQVTGLRPRKPLTEGGGGLCPNHGSSGTKRISRARERARRERPSGPAPPARAQDPHHPPDHEPLLQVSQTVPAPDERAEGDGVGLIVSGGERFRGGEGSRVLVPHEAGP